MKDTEELVKKWLESFSLTPIKYSKDEQRQGKMTPDFKVYKGNEIQFFCEVKALIFDDNCIDDTTLNQLTVDIHNSYKKFKDVNADHCLPNILALVNKKFSAGIDYLEDVLTGYWFMDNGKTYPYGIKYSEGRIKNEKSEIDLFLWFENEEHVKFRFTDTIKTNFEHLCCLFDIKFIKVNRIN